MPKILVIDDTPGEADLLHEVLTRQGYGVTVSSDGANGMLLYRSQSPAVVLVSVHVRQNRGWDILNRLREQNPAVKIVVLGGVFTEEIARRSQELGAAAYVSRHEGLKAFLAKVEQEVKALCPVVESGAGAAPRKGRVLVVDDEQVVRDLLERFLKSKGYDVITAVNGEEALDKARQERPHLMLLDMRMPGLDGLEVLKRIRASDPGVAVMMLTANTDMESARKTMELGACDYIVKPFDMNYLETTVMAKLMLVTA